MGGSWRKQGSMEALAARPAPPKPAKVATAVEYTAWQPSSQALPELNLQDMLGKSWTLASLKGKRTFVNVWATYWHAVMGRAAGCSEVV